MDKKEIEPVAIWAGVILIVCLNVWQTFAILGLKESNKYVHHHATEAERETTVYRTKTGRSYHREGCRYLSQSKIPISLSEAKAKYDPCKVCNPP